MKKAFLLRLVCLSTFWMWITTAKTQEYKNEPLIFSESLNENNALRDASPGEVATFIHAVDSVTETTVNEINVSPVKNIEPQSKNPDNNNLPLKTTLAGVNLTPYQPAGWDDRIVLSTVTGTNTSASTIYSNQTIYLDWAAINNGTLNITQTFYTKLYVDGTLKATYSTAGLNANYYASITDAVIGTLSAGTHTFKIVVDANYNVTETNESDNEYTRSKTITAAVCVNLTPYQPSGWDDKIVLSTVTGTNTTTTTIYDNQTIYLDWAVINNGTCNILQTFYYKLYVDGGLLTTYSSPGLNANSYAAITDATIGPLSAGSHTFKIVADANANVPETNESDNEYTRTKTITISVCPNLTPYQPSGWDDKIVLSTVTGTNTSATTIYDNQTIYLDWAVINSGTCNIPQTFYYKLYVDGGLLTTYSSPGLNANTYAAITDAAIGPLSAGSHTFKIVADANGNVTETNESDNEYTRTKIITVLVCVNLTPYQPSGWDDKIVLSTIAGTSISATTIYNNQPIYLDWAVINSGTCNITQTYYYKLYVDGGLFNTYSSPGLNANTYAAVTDAIIGPLSAGSHTFKIVADANGTITETNESDNEYSRTKTIQIQSIPDINVIPASITINQQADSPNTPANNPDIQKKTNGSMVGLSSLEKSKLLSEQLSGNYIEKELLIKFIGNTELSAVSGFERDHSLIRIKKFSIVPDLYHYRINDSTTVATISTKLLNNPLIEIVEPNSIYSATVNTPNDPGFPGLYGMHNTGQDGGTSDADIDAPEAWDISTGSSTVVVGIIDSGIDDDHPDLEANMWTNPGEIPGNGVDDDNNGYIDDIHGWDWAYNDNTPTDFNGHGTHVAGTVGAVGNNSIGVTGVCRTVRLMALKFLNDTGNGSTSNAISAIEYATDNGATLTNNSWGGGSFSSTLRTAILNSNMIFAAAAGNGGSDYIGDDNDVTPHYPSSYDCDNIISIASIDRNNIIATSSNFGLTSVDVGAYGVSILSTKPDNATAINFGSPGQGLSSSFYGIISGTSMATPLVAGLAALLYANNPALSWSTVKTTIMNTVVPIADLDGVTVSGGCINAYNAISNSGTSGSFTIQNLGTGNLSITSITDNKTWLTTSGYPSTPFTITPSGSQSITATVNWSLVGTTTQTGIITIPSNDPDEPSVSVQVTAIPVCTPPAINGTTPGSRCGTGTITLGATASTGTINWYAVPAGGISLGTGTSYTTPSISATTTYYVDATANGCTTNARTAILATVKTVPTITGITPGSRCGSGSVVLGAASSAGTINWYAGAAGGSILGTGGNFITPSIATTTTYYVDATLNGCTSSSRTPVTATISIVSPQVSVVNVTVFNTQNKCYNATQTIAIAGNGTSFTVQNGGCK